MLEPLIELLGIITLSALVSIQIGAISVLMSIPLEKGIRYIAKRKEQKRAKS